MKCCLPILYTYMNMNNIAITIFVLIIEMLQNILILFIKDEFFDIALNINIINI